MRTSYNNANLSYGDLLNGITMVKNPKTIIEIGILDGYSLECFINSSTKYTQINAYDLFENFNGNHSNKNELIEKFSKYPNVRILLVAMLILFTLILQIMAMYLSTLCKNICRNCQKMA